MILPVDPGLRACGVSLFSEATKELTEARYVKGSPDLQGPEAWRFMAQQIFSLYQFSASLLIIEVPDSYRTDSPTRTRNLQNLVGVAGTLAAFFKDVPVQMVRPREWKGNIDPEIIDRRAWERLSAKEQARVVLPAPSYAHNVLDSIGLGLWYLGRFKAKRVISRG